MAQAALQQSNTQVAPVDVFEGPEGLTASYGGVEYPIFMNAMTLSIVQNGTVASDPTKFKGKGGKIHITPEDPMNESANFAEKKILMPIDTVGHRFQMYEPYNKNKTNSKPICQSDSTGERPSIFIKEPCSTRCSEIIKEGKKTKVIVLCPKAKFSQNPDGTWGKPECSKTEIVAFLDITDPKYPTPVVMYLKSTALVAWTEFKKNYTRQQDFCRRNGKSGSTYAIEFSVTDNGTYYSPAFSFVDTGNNTAQFLPLCGYYKDALFTKTQQDDGNDFPEVPELENKLSEARAAEIDKQNEEFAQTAGGSEMDDLPF